MKTFRILPSGYSSQESVLAADACSATPVLAIIFNTYARMTRALTFEMYQHSKIPHPLPTLRQCGPETGRVGETQFRLQV
ncbi:hypothetical protein O181_046917 [Austropuccinia psidii MF-1]|uniref:Uncharacterized protein n=1 Tax=Austropuccinia psidii MF-1 TaxID=1389203 RepID=A0A9Q3DS78_9BASI|nr:hypothetical protein [Austropuccinia psidii MF-1]